MSTLVRKPSVNRSLVVMLVSIVALMTILNPQRFPTFGNLISMSYQVPIIGFLAMGMMVTVLTGGINLAIISTTNFTGIVTILLLRAMAGEATANASLGVTILAVAGGLGAALLIGLICGLMVAYLEIPAFLATLGIGTLLNGVNIVITKGYTWTGFPPAILAIGNGMTLGIPNPFILFLLAAAILSFALNRTVFGTALYLLGSNPTAAKYSNLKVRSIFIREYMLSSLFAAFTSFVMMGQLNSVKANYAESYLLVAVLACFLGGLDPFGGSGKTSGMVLAVIILQLVSTGVNLLRMDPFFVQAMWGIIIIAILAINFFGARLREARRLKTAKIEREKSAAV